MDLINSLESNEPHVAEQIKNKFHESFNTSKEATLLNGLFDYFVKTNSIRSVEIIVSAREPHDKHLYDRIEDGLKQPIKVQALTLLGHVVRRQPPWIYKITQHSLLKSLLKLLKTETEIIPLMSALLILTILLPMIPANIGTYLNEIFEIFSRLAAWNRNNPGKLGDEYLVHLQVGMYALFLRLYGMYPCNFLSYLRKEYGLRDHLAIFSHTIKPMLDTVKMHPLLVTASMHYELSTDRWKKISHHDVIVECAKLTLDPTERIREDSVSFTSSFRSKSIEGTTDTFSYSFQLSGNTLPFSEFFSPSIYFQHSVSPPVTDVSVPQTPQSSTPQTIRTSLVYDLPEGTSPPEAAVEATPETTPIKDLRQLSKPILPNSPVVRALTNFNPTKWEMSQSQPSSPMKKRAFKFPTADSSAFEQPKKDYSTAENRCSRILQERYMANDNLFKRRTPLNQPTSPLRVIPHESNQTEDWYKPETKNGFRFESPQQDSTQEDQEIVEIVRQGEQFRNEGSEGNYHCDSVLKEFHPPHNEDFEECEEIVGSSCTSGGLHMPNSQSMLHLVKQVRFRYHSQCITDRVIIPAAKKIRRSNSYPEMRHFQTEMRRNPLPKPTKISVGTQTGDVKPKPYEHLFLDLFPSTETELSAGPSPAPSVRFSPYDMLDRYIETSKQTNERDLKYLNKNYEIEVKSLKEQLELVHLQVLFERHRRDVHAERNRRLMGKAKSNRSLEEHNNALRDQISLLQQDLTSLHCQLDNKSKEITTTRKQHQTDVDYWQNQCTQLQQENTSLRHLNENLMKSIQEQNNNMISIKTEKQETESTLLDLRNEMDFAVKQAIAGEQTRADLEQLQKEHLILGELLLKFQDRRNGMRSECRDEELRQLKEVYGMELNSLNQQLSNRNSVIEALKTRVHDLDSAVNKHDEIYAEQKRLLKVVKEEYQQELNIVQTKYHAQRAIIKRMEENILELHTRIDRLSQQQNVVRSSHSMSSNTDIGNEKPSPHSSPPLSVSLTSSDGGSMAFLQTANPSLPSDVEIKNLQVIVDQKEQDLELGGRSSTSKADN